MKKYIDLFVVVGVVLVAIVVALIIAFSGMKKGDYDYVSLDINPEVEFVVNKKNKVVSICGLNQEGQMLSVAQDYVGQKIELAITNFLEDCARCGYLDVDATKDNCNNAVKVTVVSGITNSLELKCYQAIDRFYRDKEILGVIVENEKDMDIIKQCKKTGIGSPDKMELINTIIKNNDKSELKKLKNKSEEKLIDIILDNHKNKETIDYSDDYESLTNSNSTKYDEHISQITNKSKREFAELYTHYSKENTTKYEISYSKMSQN